MKDFSRIVEEWAMKYKPMQHEPGETSRNQRFFLISDIHGDSGIHGKDSARENSLCSTNSCGASRIDGGKVSPTYSIYFPL